MLRHLMNGSSLLAIAVREANNDQGTDDGKTDIQRAREAIAKNVTVGSKSEVSNNEPSNTDDEENEEDDNEENEEIEEKDKKEITETDEEKAAREAKETEAAKEARKTERIQKRIDKAVAAQKVAEAEAEKWKRLAEANPDKKLTEEEVQSRAETLAAEKLAAKELEKIQQDFDKACDKLQDEATKLDKDFTPKVTQMAKELGPIPSRVIGILDDLPNGAEVLKFMVDNVDQAEDIYNLKDKPEKLAIALVRVSDKLVAEKAPIPRKISNVPDQVDPVRGARVQPTHITNNDTKPEGMDSYVRKRRAQLEAKNKERGFA